MSDEMRDSALMITKDAFLKSTMVSEVADHIKTQFEILYGDDWQCIVAKSFSSAITPRERSFIYFSYNDHYILLFR